MEDHRCGRTWLPIFDQQPTGSIGALAVALSDPNVIYVGAGEAAQRPDLGVGDGMYKSTDAGKTWTHLGLRDSQQIGQVVIDPKDANRLFVAALGHPYGPNTERGIFRSTDGGTTFERVLYKDENTGATDVMLDPSNPKIVYAALWQARQGPWENGDFRGPNSGLFKSIDGGTTWKQLGGGFPTWEADRLGRIGIGIAPSRPSRLFAIVEARNPGVFRSDDAGETWSRVNSDPRVLARPSDATDVRVHPTNPDIVIVPTIVTWKSTDGGRTFTAIRGAPGGDDYQRAWFNPHNPDIIAMTSDQGAVISLNSGETWSSWYNQATAAFYHVTTDNSFPYRVCSGQQESGSVCIQSRGDDGPDHFSRVVHRRRRRVRLRRARSAGPRHRLRRQGVALGSTHRAGPAGRTAIRPSRGLPRRPHHAGVVLAGQPAQAVLLVERAVANDRTADSRGTRSALT